MSSAIVLRRLSKKYGTLTALHDLNLEINAGEIFAFLGPNGAGKTTTVKLMCGLLAPDSGSIFVAGCDLLKEPEQAKRCLGLVPDEPYLYPKLTAWEFLELIAGIYQLDGSWRQEAQRYFELFELDGAARAGGLIESYSHGMKQKVVFMSNLIRRPKVWLLDEPLVGLDPMSIRTVKDLILERAREGAAVFLSTHVLSIAESLAQRIGIIEAGRLNFVGTKAELKSWLKSRHISFGDADTLEDLFLKATISHESPA